MSARHTFKIVTTPTASSHILRLRIKADGPMKSIAISVIMDNRGISGFGTVTTSGCEELFARQDRVFVAPSGNDVTVQIV